jgi:hypothetical protein
MSSKVTEEDFRDFVSDWQAEMRLAEMEREDLVLSLTPTSLLLLQYSTASMESIPRS